MKKLFLSLVLAASVLVGCDQLMGMYDSSTIYDRLDELEDRLDKLETLCNSMNAGINTLQTLVDAVAQNDYITGVSEITENGEIVGYAITFGSGREMTLYHGEDASPEGSGEMPVIGVRKDSDGHYYWTLDGEWLLDEEGGKIIAEGQDAEGSPENTPQLKIEDECWYVSYDNGGTWQSLGKAVVEENCSMFESVDYDEENMYFVLKDGTELTLPMASSLSVSFDRTIPVAMEPNSTLEIGYTVNSRAEEITVEVSSSNDLRAKAVPVDRLTGKIHIQSGDAIDEYSKVLVIVCDGSRTITRAITFGEGDGDEGDGDEGDGGEGGGDENVFEVTPMSHIVPAEGGVFEITVRSTIGYKISGMPDWVSEMSTMSNPDTYVTVHTFMAEKNNTGAQRKGVVAMCNDNEVCMAVSLTQEAAGSGEGDGGEGDIPEGWAEKEFFHRSVAMRFTADWCGFCPIMATSFKMAQDMMPGKLEVISMHCDGNQAFELGSTEYQQMDNLAQRYLITGYPSGIVDGRSLVMNWDSEYTSNYTKEACEETERTYPTVTGVSYTSTLSGRAFTANVTAYVKNAESYKITAMLVEDYIYGWQADYTNGESYSYEHNGVPRVALTDLKGEGFSTTAANETKTFTYSATIPEKCNVGNMRLVVYIQRTFGSQQKIQSGDYGDYYIDNCVSGKIGESLELKFAE